MIIVTMIKSMAVTVILFLFLIIHSYCVIFHQQIDTARNFLIPDGFEKICFYYFYFYYCSYNGNSNRKDETINSNIIIISYRYYHFYHYHNIILIIIFIINIIYMENKRYLEIYKYLWSFIRRTTCCPSKCTQIRMCCSSCDSEFIRLSDF